MKVKSIAIKVISDSRGEKTLECRMTAENKNGIFEAESAVPSGKSKGTHEAFVLDPEHAVHKFEEIRHEISVKDFNSQEEFDNFLLSLDGTENKSNLGGNLILALSLAFARSKAKEEKKELFEYIKSISRLIGSPTHQLTNFPYPIFNVINGGAHSKNKLEFQEFQIIPVVSDFGMAFSLGKIFYRKLGGILEEKFGKENISLGDEAGYSAPFASNEEAINILDKLIKEKNYPIRIGLDCAATHFYNGGQYIVGGKNYSAEELENYYLGLIEKYNILSIEDPFAEEEFGSFANFTADLSKPNFQNSQNLNERLVITDDLTTTNPKRLKTAIDKKSGNAILVKLNQIGTVTETLEVARIASENNWKAVVSHRSGETLDNFIADLAVGINAWGIKSGAPAKPERLAKYDRLQEIYDNLTKAL